MAASRPDTGPAQGEPLLEREQEVGAFERLLGAEGSELVVVEGAAGIGKSRLLAELRRRAAAEGRRVLLANGSELEREFPFGVVRQLFEPALFEPGARERLLADAAGAARPVFESLPDDDGGGDVSFAALHGLFWLTVNLAGEGPLLICVDDLHWCDRPSLRFLVYLARRLEGLPALVVLGLRTAEPGTDPLLLGQLATESAALRLEPRSLSEAAVAEMIRARLGADPDPAFTDASLVATGGNPLLLRQLLSSLEVDGVAPTADRASTVREVGPRAVSRTVLLRLHRLSAEATTVARAVAVLGDGAELPLVAELSGLDERAVADATAALVRSEILEAGPTLGFVHPLVRDAVYHELPPGDRALDHSRAAHLLTDAGAPAEEIATHLLVAPRRGEERVVEVLADAAASARRRGAADSAVAYLRRALEEPPVAGRRAQLLLELGLAETLNSGPDATEHLREAWHAIEDPREAALVAATLARTLIFTAPGQEAMEVASEALARTPAELTDERQALHALELIAVFFGAGDQQALTRAAKPIVGEGPGARMLAAVTALGRALSGGDAEECAELARWALADGVLIEADPGLFPVPAIWVLVMADRDEALVAWEELRSLAHRRGSMLGIVTVNLWWGGTLLWRGDLRAAQESLEGARQGFRDWGLARSAETYVPAFQGMTLLALGDLDGARAMLDPSRIVGDETDGYKLLLRGWATLLLAEGRHREALAVADDLAGRFAFIANSYWAPWRSLKARALDGLGRTEAAVELAREELQLAGRFGSPSLVGRAQRELGMLEREDGTERLRTAVEILGRSTAKLELAEAELALGVALRRGRRTTESREPLRRALELASLCGAERLAETARAELHASGARPRRDALRGTASLTPSERRVVDLAADGRTNREIAQELYVTPKTVEVHLSNSYRKLDITSRRELQRALTA
jgi:DNA-binding CsgD family transcriptional regulator